MRRKILILLTLFMLWFILTASNGCVTEKGACASYTYYYSQKICSSCDDTVKLYCAGENQEFPENTTCAQLGCPNN